jgi:hypothetical protein
MLERGAAKEEGTMEQVTTSRPSRRAVLGAAAGAVAASVASALALPEAALAGSDGDVILGQSNATASTTTIETADADIAFVVSNSALSGVGIHAEGEGAAVVANVSGPPGTAIVATAGFGDGGQGGAIHAEGWSEFIGHVVMSRSGRATVLSGRSYVDVDLRSKGGLAGTPLCFANVMSYRPGLFVTMVRPNYPIAGKARIYLNRLASAKTYVAWFILG